MNEPLFELKNATLTDRQWRKLFCWIAANRQTIAAFDVPSFLRTLARRRPDDKAAEAETAPVITGEEFLDQLQRRPHAPR